MKPCLFFCLNIVRLLFVQFLIAVNDPSNKKISVNLNLNKIYNKFKSIQIGNSKKQDICPPQQIGFSIERSYICHVVEILSGYIREIGIAANQCARKMLNYEHVSKYVF